MTAPACPRSARSANRAGIALVVAGVLLSTHALTAQPLLAEELLQLYRERLAEDRLGADVALLEGEVRRARAGLEPRVRIGQAASVGFAEGAGIGVDLTASVSLPLSDPEAAANASLMRRRLELAEHDLVSERSRRLYDFQRTLRLAAHFEEVAGVLTENRRKLLSRRPEWRGLERLTGISYLSGEQLGYLELVDALARARAELKLLLGSLSASTGVREAVLEKAEVGRLPAAEDLTLPDESTCLRDGVALRRAKLVHLEDLAGAEVENGRRLPSVRLDLSTEVGYDGEAFEPLRAGAQVALQVALPASADLAGAAPVVTVAVEPARFRQEASLEWPAPVLGIEQDHTGAADDSFGRSELTARLDIRRLIASRTAAEATLQLRRLALHRLESRPNSVSMTGEPPGTRGTDVELLVAVMRARLAVLDAELDRDLATLDLLQSCVGLRGQALKDWTSEIGA